MGESDRVSVLVKSPKYRRPLNVNQDKLLKILFKFRFVSTELLAEYLARDKATVYEKLYVLVNQGYVTKKYDSSYRLGLKPARYYLSAKGVRYLLDKTNIYRSTLRGMYQNSSKSDESIDRCLLLMRLHLKIGQLYPNQFEIFSQSEMAQFGPFLRPLSDIYLRANSPAASQSYFLEIVEAAQPGYRLRARLWKHSDQAEEVWQEDEMGSYPSVLLVAANDRTEQRLLEIIDNLYPDIEFYSVTLDRLVQAKDKFIWQNETEASEFLGL